LGTNVYIIPVVDAVKKCLKSKKDNAQTKFRALFFLKECLDTKNKNIINYTSTKLLKRL
jgi:hypothetical protein